MRDWILFEVVVVVVIIKNFVIIERESLGTQEVGEHLEFLIFAAIGAFVLPFVLDSVG